MIIALSGPSGIGKGFMKESILTNHPDINELVWCTTRALRPNEANRKSISEDEFAQLVAADKLTLVQGMFGHCYGLAVNELQGKEGIWLTEIHPFVVEGARSINPKIKMVGLITEDLDLLRERLLLKRKTEDPAEVEVRLKAAIDEMKAIKANSSMFERIVLVSRENESQIPDIAQEIISDFMKEGE